MAPRKKGLLPKLKTFLDALSDRYQRALTVIDEALASDNLKDKIWAVDLILKRLSTTESDPKAAPATQTPTPEDFSNWSEEALLARIRELTQPPPESEP